MTIRVINECGLCPCRDAESFTHKGRPALDFSNGSLTSTALAFTAWFFVFFYYHGVGITLGYHRLLTHKSFKCPDWLMYLIVSGGYFCFMGGPVNWVGVHRLHHQKSDTPDDPHSPNYGGFKHALYQWMFTMAEKQTNNELRKQVPDLLQHKGLCWFGVDHCAEQAQLCLAFCVLFRLLILVCFGYPAFFANLLASFVVFWSPQLVNAVCHLKTAGYRTFETRDESRNVWYVAALSWGEGWHNNHHAIPRSARHGMDWWELDITYITICILEKLGLVTDVVRPDLSNYKRTDNRKQPSKKPAGITVSVVEDFDNVELDDVAGLSPTPAAVASSAKQHTGEREKIVAK